MIKYISIITCPQCHCVKEETMSVDSCHFFYECIHCKARLRPIAGDCCVFCSYGSVKCPPQQESEKKGNEMVKFKVYTKDDAPQASKQLLEDREKKYGFLPNLFGAFVGSPAVLEAYISLSNLLEKTTLTPQEQQIVLLAVSFENGCEYCVAAHSMVARMMVKVPEEIVEALRNGSSLADKKTNALVNFTRAMVQKRGRATENDLQQFFDGGYTQAQALEVILGITMKTLSNYTNHIVKTPLDKIFEAHQWQKQNVNV